MTDFNYFSTFDESISMLADLCAQGLKIVAQPNVFDEPTAPIFEQIDEMVIATLKDAPAFYLAGPFSQFPVAFKQLKSGPCAGKYVVDLLTQGPLMQCLIARVNLVDGTPLILPGQISYQDVYKNPNTSAWEKASPELKAAYKSAVASIKKHCVRHVIENKKIFIGPMALALYEKGEATINKTHIIG